MLTDSAIVDRLRDAAERVDVDVALDAVLAPPVALDRERQSGRRSYAVLVAACLLLIVGLTVAANVGRGNDGRPLQAAASWTPPITVPVGAPEPGAFSAHVATPPGWLGDLVSARRSGGVRSGQWVSTAIGRPTTDGFASPITVAAFVGSWRALDDASSVVLDGRTYLSTAIGEWQALVTVTEPAVVAHGYIDQDTLHEVLLATSVASLGANFTVAIESLPADYVELVPPHVLATDVTPRRTLAEVGGALAIHETSDAVDALLASASSGADLTRHDLGATIGWSGTATANPYGPLTFLVWSPQPGVVFEIVSTDPSRRLADLVELARATTAIASDDWDVLYPE